MKNTFELLRSTRKRRRISAETLAQATDYTRASVYRYEKNEFKTISYDTLCKIAVYLGVNLDQLLKALSADHYDNEELSIIESIYKKEYEAIHGKIPTFTIEDDADDELSKEVENVLHNDVRRSLNTIYESFKEDTASYSHIDLIRYCVENLDDAQAIKALKLLKVVFDE